MEKAVVVTVIPSIHGLIFRRFGEQNDYKAVTDLINIVNVADNLEEVETIKEFTNSSINSTNCEYTKDTLVAQINNRVIGFTHLWWEITVQHEKIYNSRGFVHPEWRRKRIGQALLLWGEKRLREIAASHTKDSSKKILQLWSRSAESGCSYLAESQGYQPVRFANRMVRSLEDGIPIYPLPEGLEIHPAIPSTFRTIWIAMEEAFQDHWSRRVAMEEHYNQWLESPKFQPDLWQVAWDGHEVAGMALNNINYLDNDTFKRKRGWTDPVCVRRAWRRRGLARALICRSMTLLRAHGMTESTLRVDTQNPCGALDLYLNLGYQTYHVSTGYRKLLDA